MENTSWLKQTPDKPLFPDLLWGRPENKRHAGKLLIVGGHQQSFNAVSEAYSAAARAGIGTTRVMLPDKLQKMLSKLFPEAEYAPSTPIGSFSRQALDTLLDAAEWADDFGHNSETAILLESFIEKYDGLLTLTGDSLDYFFSEPDRLLERTDTLIVGELRLLQKLIQSKVAIKQGEDLMQLLNKLSIFTTEVKSYFITSHSDQIIIAGEGRVSTTPSKAFQEGSAATYASVWRLQQPEKPFEAVTTAVYYLIQE
jgi:NAD(P)H-hydrate repair Nnr-like enzyme with NAD(P)H-hydrate dehydratase domain